MVQAWSKFHFGERSCYTVILVPITKVLRKKYLPDFSIVAHLPSQASFFSQASLPEEHWSHIQKRVENVHAVDTSTTTRPFHSFTPSMRDTALLNAGKCGGTTLSRSTSTQLVSQNQHPIWVCF